MILRWDIVTVDHLSRNRYWGEPDARPGPAYVAAEDRWVAWNEPKRGP